MLPRWIERTLKQGLVVYRDLDINEDTWRSWITILKRRGWGLEFSSSGNRFWAPGYRKSILD